MVEVDNGILILIVAVIVPSITIPLTIRSIFVHRIHPENQPKRTKKGIVSDAEITSLEEFKAVTAESIAMLKQQNDELKAKNKSLQNTINVNSKKWKSQDEEDDEEEEEDPRFRELQRNGITPEVLAGRKALIKAELAKKLNPQLLNFPMFDKIVNDIACDPDFENLASAFIASQGKPGGNQNQSATEQAVTDFL